MTVEFLIEELQRRSPDLTIEIMYRSKSYVITAMGESPHDGKLIFSISEKGK